MRHDTLHVWLSPQILFKLLNSGYLSDMHGCISTGKEANVYHATTADGTDLAVKIYKTSILVFKDRDRQALCLLHAFVQNIGNVKIGTAFRFLPCEAALQTSSGLWQ